MPGLLSDSLSLIAWAEPAKAAEPNSLYQYLPLLGPIVVLYFLLIRPSQQQEKKRREMLGHLKKNDKVVTSSGMYGTVLSVDEAADKVLLRLDDDGKVKIAFTRASIVRVLGEPADKAS